MGDGFEAVEDSWRDMDENSVVFPDDNAVSFPMGGAFGPVIIKSYFGHPMNDRHAVRLFFVRMPRFDHPRINRAEIRLAKTGKVRVILSQNLHHSPPVITVLAQGNDL
jgi:hypothetical protein